MLDYLSSISSDGEAFASIVETGLLDADVPSCPGWSLRDLAHHVGYIQRWARLAALTGAEPDEGEIDGPPADDQLADWLRSGRMALIETLGSVPGDAPTWHPFPVARVMAVWPRRQAHEMAIHLWDAQAAVGAATLMDPALAGDFVHEYFDVIVPRVMDRDGRQPPIGVLDIELVDVGAKFSVRSTRDSVLVTAATAVYAPFTGTAEDVLLALWLRRPLPDMPTSGVALDWLSFGGN